MSRFVHTLEKRIEQIPSKSITNFGYKIELPFWEDADFEAGVYANLVTLNKSTLPRQDGTDELTEELTNLIENVDAETLEEKTTLLHLVEKLIKKIREDLDKSQIGYQLVGSLPLNLFISGSDLDLVFMTPPSYEETLINYLLSDKLADISVHEKNKLLKNSEFTLVVLTMKVDGKEITIDCGINNYGALRTTNILSTFATSNPVFQSMTKILKMWFKRMELRKSAGFPSYVSSLLSIHFLTYDYRSPNYIHLYPTIFHEGSNPFELSPFGFILPESKTTNSHSFGQTIKAIFQHLAHFDWLNCMVNVKSPQKMLKETYRNVNGHGLSELNYSQYSICIQDMIHGLSCQNKVNSRSTFEKFLGSLAMTNEHFSNGGKFSDLKALQVHEVGPWYAKVNKNILKRAKTS